MTDRAKPAWQRLCSSTQIKFRLLRGRRGGGLCCFVFHVITHNHVTLYNEIVVAEEAERWADTLPSLCDVVSLVSPACDFPHRQLACWLKWSRAVYALPTSPAAVLTPGRLDTLISSLSTHSTPMSDASAAALTIACNCSSPSRSALNNTGLRAKC